MTLSKSDPTPLTEVLDAKLPAASVHTSSRTRYPSPFKKMMMVMIFLSHLSPLGGLSNPVHKPYHINQKAFQTLTVPKILNEPLPS